MDGKNDCSGRGLSSAHSLVWLPVLLCLVAAFGCAAFNLDPIDLKQPKDLKQYLPPNEKEDVLLLCFYESGLRIAKDNSISSWPPVTVEDVQILSYPYDDVHLGFSWGIGFGSLTWAYLIQHERCEIWLLTRKRQIIRIPITTSGQRDRALSMFFVVTNPPLASEDFCTYEKGDPSVVRFVQGRWRSLEDARLAQKFWAECPVEENRSPVRSHEDSRPAQKFWADECPVEENPPPVSLNWWDWDWKLHSIFGKTGDILNSRRTAIP